MSSSGPSSGVRARLYTFTQQALPGFQNGIQVQQASLTAQGLTAMLSLARAGGAARQTLGLIGHPADRPGRHDAPGADTAPAGRDDPPCHGSELSTCLLVSVMYVIVAAAAERYHVVYRLPAETLMGNVM